MRLCAPFFLLLDFAFQNRRVVCISLSVLRWLTNDVNMIMTSKYHGNLSTAT